MIIYSKVNREIAMPATKMDEKNQNRKFRCYRNNLLLTAMNSNTKTQFSTHFSKYMAVRSR